MPEELLSFSDYFLIYTAAFLKHPRTQTGVTGMDYQSADSEHLKRIRTGQPDEVWMNKTVSSDAPFSGF